MAILVDAQKIQVTKEEYIKALIIAWEKTFEEHPKKEQIGVIYSQTMIETGLKAFWNNNIGNIKYVPSKNPEDDKLKKYMMLPNVWEIINGQKVIFNPPHPATWFRAFDTLAEGIEDHFQFLAGKRWKLAWTAVVAGDPSDFARKLKIQGYYTAPLADYEKGLNLYFKSYMSSNMFDAINDVIRLERKTDPDITPVMQPLIFVDNELPVLDESDEVIKLTKWQEFKKKLFGLVNLTKKT